MARDPRKHQKKKERRNKREKDKRKLTTNRSLLLGFDFIEKAAYAPFGVCKFHANAFDQGMGNLLVSRALPNGRYVYVTFLVDLFCLGVKDIACNWCSAFEIEALARKIYREDGAITLQPEEAKKLCDGAVAFAAKYGLSPHEDFKKAYSIFANVDSSTCLREFPYGKDDKPFYISGPHDSRDFQRRILDTLTRTAGVGQFDYLMEVSANDANLYTLPDGVRIVNFENDGNEIDYVEREDDEIEGDEEGDEADEFEIAPQGDVYEMTKRGMVLREANRP